MSRVARGQYGPIPSEVIPSAALRRSRRALWIAGMVGRHSAFPLGLRTLSPDETAAIATVAADARFAVWIPTAVPVGFSVAGVDLAPYSRDVVTIRLSDDTRRRSLEISQRKRWLPLVEELTTAGVPFDRVPSTRTPIYLMHGKYGGEPIDLSFWNSRRALVFERGALRIECRESVGQGPGLSALIRFAASAFREGTGTGLGNGLQQGNGYDTGQSG